MGWSKTIQRYRTHAIGETDTCVYCGETKAREYLTIDHVIPLHVLALCGIDKFASLEYDKNLVVCCRDCNRDKGRNILLRHPVTKEALKQIFGI